MAGVGLNVDNEQPTTCLNAVLKDMSPAASNLLKREEILAAFFNKFEKFFHLFIDQGNCYTCHLGFCFKILVGCFFVRVQTRFDEMEVREMMII